MESLVLSTVSILNNSGNQFSISILKDKIKSVNTGPVSSLENSYKISFKNALAFPGLFNAHDHLEFNLFPPLRSKIYKDYLEWSNDIQKSYSTEINSVLNIPIELRIKFGMIKNLFNGITTVMHHGKNFIQKSEQIINVFNGYNYLHSVSLEKNWRAKLMLKLNKLPFVLHLGEGIGEEVENEINKLLKWNIFKRKIVAVHGISLKKHHANKLTALIWCPDSNLSLYNKTANILELKTRMPVLFGSDSNLTSDPNFWNQLRIARKINALNDDELINSITSLPGELFNIKNTGKIMSDFRADVVIVKKKSEDNFEAFFNVNPEDILIIIRNGKIILFDDSLENECAYLNYSKFKIRGSIKFTDKEIVAIIRKLEDYKVRLPLEISTIDH